MSAKWPPKFACACPHDCPDTCAMLVTVEDGVAVEDPGRPVDAVHRRHAVHQGRALPRAHLLARPAAPPDAAHRRKGRRQFERIAWDEALDEIAARLKALAARRSARPSCRAATPAPWAWSQYSSMDRRFFHRLGATLLDRTLCSTAGKVGLKATLGGSVGMDPERFDEAKLILLWGANPVVSNLHLWSRVQEAKRRGAKVVAIDPVPQPVGGEVHASTSRCCRAPTARSRSA